MDVTHFNSFNSLSDDLSFAGSATGKDGLEHGIYGKVISVPEPSTLDLLIVPAIIKWVYRKCVGSDDEEKKCEEEKK